MMVRTEIGYMMIEPNMIKSPQLVCHDCDELQRMIMVVMISIKSWSMCGFDELLFFYGDVVHWCRYAEDYYKEELSPPTDSTLVEVMLIAGRDVSLQKKPSFRKNLKKLLICGDDLMTMRNS